MRILVVDDNKLIRAILSKLLENFGSVVTAKSGEEGVAFFIAAFSTGCEPYSVVCMDMSMGAGMTGAEALAEIRNFEAEGKVANPVKVLMITAFADKESVLKTRDLCDGYLLKPIVREMLFAKLESFGFYAGVNTFPPPPPQEPEEDDGRIKGSPDAEDIRGKANFSAWERSPILAQRTGLIVALLPKRTEPDALPSFSMGPPERVEFFASVRPYSLAARVEADNIPLSCGPGMAYIPKIKAFVARIGGRAVIKDGVFDIDPLLEISGDLRYRSIDFAGRLHLKGDVSDGLSISADEGIEIEGDVGACQLRSLGDVSLRRLNGHGLGAIDAGGCVKADYVYDASIRSDGEVSIARECVNSSVKSLSSVKAGILIGGRCTAFKLLELERAGSPKEIATQLRAGFNFEDEDAVDELKGGLAAINDEISKLEQLLGPFASDFKKVFSLSERQQERIFELAGRRLILKYCFLPDAEAEVAEAQGRVGRFPSAKIWVSDTLHRGVLLEVGAKSETFPRECMGPLAITANSDDSRYFIERQWENTL